MVEKKTLDSIRSAYGKRSNILDTIEFLFSWLKEKLIGVDCSVFGKTISYYRETHGQVFSKEDALSRALDKAGHKDVWYEKERLSIEEKMAFYREVHIYPFRQPYIKRFGGFRWYVNLVRHIERARVLEYGCGSAVLTEYLIERFPRLRYTVADIPSVTLDFVKWKKKTYNYGYEVSTIGTGKEGIPLKNHYDLIICQDVLEHTPNPLDIVMCFIDHMATAGVLVIDFLEAPGGENLEETMEQREEVKQVLKERLIALKAIDEPEGNNGLYVKE